MNLVSSKNHEIASEYKQTVTNATENKHLLVDESWQVVKKRKAFSNNNNDRKTTNDLNKASNLISLQNRFNGMIFEVALPSNHLVNNDENHINVP